MIPKVEIIDKPHLDQDILTTLYFYGRQNVKVNKDWLQLFFLIFLNIGEIIFQIFNFVSVKIVCF